MNSQNIITKKPGFMRGGEQVLAETKEEFLDFCKSLSKDFMGVMCLYGRIKGRLYTAGLLLDGGNITAASLEDVDNEKIIFGDEAISQIKEKLSGTTGNLEVYSFSHNGMGRVREENRRALLTRSISFSHLGMMIKPRGRDEGIKDNTFTHGKKIEELRTDEGFNLVDFAHGFPFTSKTKEEGGIPLKKEEILGEVGGIEFNLKRKNLTELKRRKQVKDQSLAERISRIRKKKARRGIGDMKKVETSIDELHQLVQKYGKLRIDDKLTHRLGVNRSQIENWALLLEEHGLLELHYPAIGEPEIRKVKEKE